MKSEKNKNCLFIDFKKGKDIKEHDGSFEKPFKTFGYAQKITDEEMEKERFLKSFIIVG